MTEDQLHLAELRLKAWYLLKNWGSTDDKGKFTSFSFETRCNEATRLADWALDKPSGYVAQGAKGMTIKDCPKCEGYGTSEVEWAGYRAFGDCPRCKGRGVVNSFRNHSECPKVKSPSPTPNY